MPKVVRAADGAPFRWPPVKSDVSLTDHASMSNWLTLAISCFALGVSGLTAWLTFFRKGRLAMTQPTTVFFGPDGRNFDGDSKVYLRTLLYCTAKRGYVLESLHLSLQRN